MKVILKRLSKGDKQMQVLTIEPIEQLSSQQIADMVVMLENTTNKDCRMDLIEIIEEQLNHHNRQDVARILKRLGSSFSLKLS